MRCKVNAGSPSVYKASRDFEFFDLPGGVTRSQTRRDTDFAIPGYSISAMIPRRGRKSKIFLSVVIPVVKAAFVPFSAAGGKPAIARVVRPSGLLSKPRMDRVYALPKQARYQLRYTRLFRYFIRPVAFTQIKRDTSFATPGYLVLWGGEPLYGTVCGRRRLQGNGMEH